MHTYKNMKCLNMIHSYDYSCNSSKPLPNIIITNKIINSSAVTQLITKIHTIAENNKIITPFTRIETIMIIYKKIHTRKIRPHCALTDLENMELLRATNAHSYTLKHPKLF